MRPRDNEDKNQTRRTGGAKQACNRQKPYSRMKESEVVEACPGILKKLSPTRSCSHNSRKQLWKPHSQTRIKKSEYPQGLGSTVSFGIVRKQAAHEDVGQDIRQEKNEEFKLLSNKCSRSKTEIAVHEYFTESLNVDDAGSTLESELKRMKPSNCVSQEGHILHKEITSTPPSLAISTPTGVRSDMNLFNFRKYVEDLVEDQCWLVGKIIQLKAEVNVIVKTMEEAKGQGYLRGSASNVEVKKSVQFRPGYSENLVSSNNRLLNGLRPDSFGDNNNHGLSSPTLNISEASSSVDVPGAPSSDSHTSPSRDVTIVTGHNGRHPEMSGTVSLPPGISPARESACDLCPSSDQSMSCAFRLVQYMFLLVLVAAQFIVQFVTRGM